MGPDQEQPSPIMEQLITSVLIENGLSRYEPQSCYQTEYYQMGLRAGRITARRAIKKTGAILWSEATYTYTVL